MSTNLNEVTIVACKEAPNGEQIAVTSVVTSGTGQILATVPGGQDEWAEVTIEACNIDATTAFCLRFQWINGTDDSGIITQKLTNLEGLAVIVDGRLARGGTRLYGSCLNAAASGAGTSGKINVYPRPFLLHKK